MRRMIPMLAAAALVLAIAVPAQATTTRIPYECDEYLVALEGGTEVIEDGVLYVRGTRAVHVIEGDAQCAGTQTATVDIDLDLTTWSGVVRVRATLELDAFDGGYEGLLIAHFTTPNPLDWSATDIWAGRYVRHGFGDLEGWQARGTVIERTHLFLEEQGYAFKPGD